MNKKLYKFSINSNDLNQDKLTMKKIVFNKIILFLEKSFSSPKCYSIYSYIQKKLILSLEEKIQKLKHWLLPPPPSYRKRLLTREHCFVKRNYQGRFQEFSQGGEDFQEHKILKIGTKNSMRKSFFAHAQRVNLHAKFVFICARSAKKNVRPPLSIFRLPPDQISPHFLFLIHS